MIGDVVTRVLAGFAWAVLAYFVVVNGFQTVLLASAGGALWRHRLGVWREDTSRLLGSEVTPTISVLAPAHDEEATVAASVTALLTLSYPSLEVVLVNDGSGDATLSTLSETFELTPIHPIFQNRVASKPVRGLYRSRVHPGLLVVDKVNGGKADALNAGLNCATGQLVCAIDADTLIEPDALLRVVRPFLTREDVVAAGGTIRVANGSQIRGGRPVAWTEVPETLRELGRQRDRWHRGLADVLHRHRRLFANARYRGLGLVVFPYYVVVELLGPVVEALGVAAVLAGLALGAVDVRFALLFVAVAYGWSLLLNLATLALEECSYRRYRRGTDLLVLLAWSVVEGIGYRQLTVVWRLRGLWRYLRGRTEWGTMNRRGFGGTAAQSLSVM